MNKIRILVVDDEPRYIRVMQANLEARGYEVLAAHNGPAAIDLAFNQNPELVILDIRMPGMDGYEVCQHIRKFSTVPIIMLTALSEDIDKVKGLDAGADDYVTKPFSVSELLARVRANLRRVQFSQKIEQRSTFQAGELVVDMARQRVFLGEQEVSLTPTEYKLLSELVNQAGRILTPEYLLNQVWGFEGDRDIRLVWQVAYRLRRKIERDPQHPKYIQTRPGMGYIFQVPDEPGTLR